MAAVVTDLRSDQDSSDDEDIVVEDAEDTEDAAPAAAAGAASSSMLPEQAAESAQAFPPHEFVVDSDEQQWVYYRTRAPDETCEVISTWFDVSTEEVVQSNAERYPKLTKKSKLHQDSLLIIGACDGLLVCSSCRHDRRPGDEIVICDGECGRGYHMTCAKLDALPEGDWHCSFCKAGWRPGQTTPAASERPRWKRPSGSCGSWERMGGDDRAPPQVKREEHKAARRPTSAAPNKKAKVEPPASPPLQLVAVPPPQVKQEDAAAPPEPKQEAKAAHVAANVPPATFIGKVSKIKELFGLEEDKPIPVAIEEANKMMGLPTEGNGKLPEQVDALIRKIYLEP